MTSTLFATKPHTIPASHIRGLPAPYTAHPPALKLCLNQYTPLAPSPAGSSEVTIVFVHANGFHKEMYEPYFCDLLEEMMKNGVGIRSIWAPDAVHQGESGVVNEELLAETVDWDDMARDVLSMVDHFASEMTPPIIGIGHSYGAYAIAEASLRHPSLFASIVLIDPVFTPSTVGRATATPAIMSSKRQDVWPSFAAAESYFRSRPFYQHWDPRVLDLHLKYGLRPLPTPLYPDIKSGYTLTTTKRQEVQTYLLHNPSGPQFFHRRESARMFHRLKELSVPVFYIFGQKSQINREEGEDGWRAKMRETRGAEKVLVEGAGHLVPMDKPVVAARETARWVQGRVGEWRGLVEGERGGVEKALGKAFLGGLSKL